jgi:lipopolysaccharide export system protein LptA
MVLIPVCIYAGLATASGDVPQIKQIDEKLTVEYHQSSFDVEKNELTCRGQVKAVYGLTTLYADELVLTNSNLKTEGRATGHVRVEDPDGNLAATSLIFDWTKQTGTAQNVHIKSDRATVEAKSLIITPKEWILKDVSATTCGYQRPIFMVSAPLVSIKTGKRAVAHDIALQIYGHKVATLPSFTTSLDKRVSGFTLPIVNFEENGRGSISWSNSFLLDDQTSIGGHLGATSGSYLKSSLDVTHSFIAPDRSHAPLTPRSDFAERFSFGFFDSIETHSIESEYQYLRSTRNAISANTTWNIGTPGRLGSDRFNKPWELAFERGGEVGDLGLMGQVRVQNIQIVNRPAQTRLATISTMSLPAYRIVDGVYTHLRLDGACYLNKGSSFGWGQAQAGLLYRPFEDVGLGVAYVTGGETGNPAFESDRLSKKSAIHVRTQWGRGPSKFGFLAKYDFAEKRWYDDEFSFSQVVGCFEPYVTWRRYPSQFTIGFSFRADQLFEKLTRRDFRASK